MQIHHGSPQKQTSQRNPLSPDFLNLEAGCMPVGPCWSSRCGRLRLTPVCFCRRQALAAGWLPFHGGAPTATGLLNDSSFLRQVFQALAAGCVPIYDGAPNAADFLPKNSTLFVQDFRSPEHLARHMQVRMCECTCSWPAHW